MLKRSAFSASIRASRSTETLFPSFFTGRPAALGLTAILYVTTRDLLLEIQDELKAGLRTRLFCVGYLLFLVFHMVAVGSADPEPVP
jgi:hypothetical protein